MLRVIGIKGKNILGLEEIGIEPGKVTVIRGRNGTGKTSALELVKAVFGGTNLATLKRIGAPEDEEPEAVIILKGPEGEFELTKKGAKTVDIKKRVIGEDGSPTQAFEKVKKPASFVRALVDGKMMNPIDFLTEKDDNKRVLLLLAALPLELDSAALFTVMGVSPGEIGPIPTGLHPLQELSLIREDVFKTRTGVNTDMSGYKKSVDKIKRSLPAEIPTGLTEEITSLDEEISTAEVANEKQKQERCAKIDAQIENLKNRQTAYEQRERAAMERLAASKRAAVEDEISIMANDLVAELEETHARQEDNVIEFNAERTAVMEESFDVSRATEKKKITLATLREQQKTVVAQLANKDMADDFQGKADSLESESERLTHAIKALDQYRRDLAQNLPIEGLEIDGAVIRLHGIPFEQLNTAKRIKLAVKVACLRSKDKTLPLMLIDGAEALDSHSFGLLESEIDKQNVQLIAGCVTDGDFGWDVR